MLVKVTVNKELGLSSDGSGKEKHRQQKEGDEEKQGREKIVEWNVEILYPLGYQSHHQQVKTHYQYGKRIIDNVSGYEYIRA